jgi:hypothetical protein
VRLYHYVDGQWQVFHGSGLVAGGRQVGVETRLLPGEILMLLVDTLPPVVRALCDIDAPLSSGAGMRDTVEVSDNIANVVVSYLYGRGNEAPRAAAAVTLAGTKDTVSTAVSSTFVGNNGLRLYVVVSDGVHVDTVNLSRQVRLAGSGTSDITTADSQWVVLRTTAQLDSGAMSRLVDLHLGTAGVYNPKQLRVFRWYDQTSMDGSLTTPGAAFDWVEYQAPRESVFTLEPGRLMWAKSSKTELFNFGPGLTTSLRDTVVIELAPNNWTDLALPYAFAMKVGDVLDATGVAGDSIQYYWWQRNTAGVYVTQPFHIKGIPDATLVDRTRTMGAGPGDGFSVYNPLESTVSLRIPPVCAAMSGVSKRLGTAVAAGSWVLKVNVDGAPMSLCGYEPGTGARRLYPQGPAFTQSGVGVVDKGRRWAHAVDGAADQWGGHSYELSFYNQSKQVRPVQWSVAGLEGLADSMHAWLVDPEGGEIIELGRESQERTINVGGGASLRRVLAVGGNGYQQHLLAQVKPFARFAAYPNPFRGVLTVSFMMPVGVQKVEWRMFDALGRVVWQYTARDIKAGSVNRLVWDGRTSFNTRAAAGHYVLQLQAFDEQGTRMKTQRQHVILMR